MHGGVKLGWPGSRSRYATADCCEFVIKVLRRYRLKVDFPTDFPPMMNMDFGDCFVEEREVIAGCQEGGRVRTGVG